MVSNSTYHYFFKYSLLGVSFLLLGGAVISWFDPESMKVNGKPGSQEISTTLIFVLFAVLAFLIFLLVKEKFAIVELENQKIKIRQNGEERIVSWLEIEEINLIRFVSPPLYKLKLKETEETIWFNTQPEYVSINGFVFDRSEMGAFIKKKKEEFKI